MQLVGGELSNLEKGKGGGVFWCYLCVIMCYTRGS